MTEGIFKAYDIRGIYPKEINEVVAQKIAQAVARRFRNGPIVIGRDARLSSPKLYRVIIQELKRVFPNRILYPAGLTTTPQLYFLVNYFRATAGMMVTASHNPRHYNGFKVVKAKAEPVGGAELKRLVLER